MLFFARLSFPRLKFLKYFPSQIRDLNLRYICKFWPNWLKSVKFEQLQNELASGQNLFCFRTFPFEKYQSKKKRFYSTYSLDLCAFDAVDAHKLHKLLHVATILFNSGDSFTTEQFSHSIFIEGRKCMNDFSLLQLGTVWWWRRSATVSEHSWMQFVSAACLSLVNKHMLKLLFVVLPWSNYATSELGYNFLSSLLLPFLVCSISKLKTNFFFWMSFRKSG